MKWTKKLLTAVPLVLMLCSVTVFAKNNVSEIDIDVTVRDDGSAYIVQNWKGTFDEGTENYIVSPGVSGMQPRDPCRPWRGTLASGHKPR